MNAGEWRWQPTRSDGIWRHGCGWARPLTAAAPWVALALILVEFALIEGRLAAAPGVSFDLPPAVTQDELSDLTGFAALAMPVVRDPAKGPETQVFYDDARYMISDVGELAALRNHLSARPASQLETTMLLLADKRIPVGDVLKLVGLVRECGVVRVQVAEKRVP